MSEQAEFPADLAAVPEGERIPQAFGWAPSAWGMGFFAFAWLVLFQPAALHAPETISIIAAFLLAFALMVMDLRRRKRPRVLVRMGYGPKIGIYRDGRLQRSVVLDESRVFIRHPANTWGPLIALAFASAGLLLAVWVGFASPSWGVRLAPLFALGFTVGLISTMVKTRLRCEECLFPYPSARGYERILVLRAAIPRIFSRPA